MRQLAMEHLEQRWLLSADFPGWQNLAMPADVNNDGFVAPSDALLLVHDLRSAGARALEPIVVSSGVSLASGDGTAEGEQIDRLYLDVNGDGSLTHADALLVVHELQAEGQVDLVEMRLEATDTMGTVVSTVEQGDSFFVNVYVHDLRGDSVANPGVFQAYLDITYDQALATAIGAVTFGDAYQEDTAGNVATPGLVDEAGGTQTGYGLESPFVGPLGDGEFLLARIPFEATSPGMVTFAGDPADLAIYHDVTLFNPPDTVPTDDVIYGSTAVTIVAGPVVAHLDTFSADEDSANNVLDVLLNDEINTEGSLSIVSAGATDHGGTVVNHGGFLVYTPAPNFVGTETFTYTITDGLENTDEGTVIVTIANTNNDPPVAGDDGGTGYSVQSDGVLTTPNVLLNDTDIDGGALSVVGLDTTNTKGVVADNGNGTFQYNPNGQFDYLGYGEQATDTFTYTVTDGRGGFDTATVSVVINGAPPVPGDVTGLVYADVNNNGVRDEVERTIGGVEVRLQGTDMFGSPLLRTARTDAKGYFKFANVSPGNYELVEVQPTHFLDGIDTVRGVVNTGTNDHVAITSMTSLSGLDVNFGERSLHPAFLGNPTVLNTSLRDGIAIGFDGEGNMLWYSVLNGWDDVTSVSVTMAEDGLTAELSVASELEGDLVFTVPLAPTAMEYHVLGTTAEGSVVQFMGTMAQFQERAIIQAAQEEAAASGQNSIDDWFAQFGRR